MESQNLDSEIPRRYLNSCNLDSRNRVRARVRVRVFGRVIVRVRVSVRFRVSVGVRVGARVSYDCPVYDCPDFGCPTHPTTCNGLRRPRDCRLQYLQYFQPGIERVQACTR